MKQPAASARKCATLILEAVPHLMRLIRERVRSENSPDLSMPQFRALAFIGRNANATLSDVAGFLATPLPTTCKLVDGLVVTGLAERKLSASSRRNIALNLTPAGREKYAAAVKSAEDYLASRLGKLPPAERAGIALAMETLHGLFEDTPETADQ